MALGLGTALPGWARLLLVLCIAGAAWRGHRRIWRNPAAVRQVGWNSEGQWLLVSGRGLQPDVEWLPPLRQLGPWLWACFLVAGHRKWVLIDTQTTEPGALSALKARATLLRR